MKCAVAVLLLILVVGISCARLSNEERIGDSLNPGRTGDIFISPNKGYVRGDSVLVVKTESKRRAVRDISIADYIAHSVGLEPQRVEESSHLFGEANIFKKVRVNLMFVVDSVGEAILKRFPGLKMMEGSSSYAIEESSVGQDNVALLSSIASAAPVSKHGIPAKTWFTSAGQEVDAFSSASSYSKVSNIADRLKDAFNGESLIVSASSNFELASALSPNPLHALEDATSQAFGLYWNPKIGSFDSIYSHLNSDVPQFQVSKEDIIRFPNLRRVKSSLFTFEMESGIVTLTVGNKKSARFEVADEEDFLFLAELEFVLSTVHALQTEPMWKQSVTDNVPDLLAFSFGSFKHLLEYGLDSSKFEVALRVMDDVMHKVSVDIKALYKEDRVLIETVFLDQSKVVAEQNTMLNQVAEALDQTKAVVYGNEIFSLFEASSQSVCDKLNPLIASLQLTAFCPTVKEAHHENVAHQVFNREFQVRAANSRNATVPPKKPEEDEGKTESEVIAFQLTFWISIAFFLIIMFTASAMSSLGIPEDSPLIRNMPDIFKSHSQLRELGED